MDFRSDKYSVFLIRQPKEVKATMLTVLEMRIASLCLRKLRHLSFIKVKAIKIVKLAIEYYMLEKN